MSLLCSTENVVSGCNGKVFLACHCPVRHPEVQLAVVFVYITFGKPYTLQMINEPLCRWLYKYKTWVCAERPKYIAIGGRELPEIGETMTNRKETCRQIFGTDRRTYYKKIQINPSKTLDYRIHEYCFHCQKI